MDGDKLELGIIFSAADEISEFMSNMGSFADDALLDGFDWG